MNEPANAPLRLRLPGKAWWTCLGRTLRYCLHTSLHPFDGFWDLTREHRGSLAAAHVIVLALLATRVLRLQYTSFLLLQVNWAQVNIYKEMLAILLPLAIWCLANWGLTTLFEGKGTMGHIYMGTAYALAPYVLIQLPLILLSHVLTMEEGAFYTVLSNVSLIWCGGLLIVAMMMIHDYSLGKTLVFVLFSLFGVLIILFVMMLFLYLLSDGIAYFVSLYKELAFRLY